MKRKTLVCCLLLLTLTALGGCIIHDPGYYPSHRGYYSGHYLPHYYSPYLYAPFWFGGYYIFDDSHRGHHFHKYRGFDRHGGSRGRR